MVYGSITLKFGFWAPQTYLHHWFLVIKKIKSWSKTGRASVEINCEIKHQLLKIEMSEFTKNVSSLSLSSSLIVLE